MAYSATNPPRLAGQAVVGGRIWEYRSTDAAADVDGDGYITDAVALGMKVGDLVLVHDTDASPYTVTIHTVGVLNADGSADLNTAASTSGTLGD
jgi:hypothetical protein